MIKMFNVFIICFSIEKGDIPVYVLDYIIKRITVEKILN